MSASCFLHLLTLDFNYFIFDFHAKPPKTNKKKQYRMNNTNLTCFHVISQSLKMQKIKLIINYFSIPRQLLSWKPIHIETTLGPFKLRATNKWARPNIKTVTSQYNYLTILARSSKTLNPNFQFHQNLPLFSVAAAAATATKWGKIVAKTRQYLRRSFRRK